MKKKGTILIADDNTAVLSALKLLLGNYFDKIILSRNPDGIPAILKNNDVDVILLDMNFRARLNTGNEGLFWLDEIKKADEEIQVVVFTAYAEIDLAVEAIKRGASDFVVKPWDNGKLVASLQHAFQIRKSRRDMEKLKEMREGLMAYGDEPLISQVLVNLIKNAAQALQDIPFCTEKSISAFAGTDSNENVFIRIWDNGNAIPKDIAEDIFTPFFTTRETGSGFGLSISRQIMLLHRGSLRLTSNRNGNVEFTITFP